MLFSSPDYPLFLIAVFFLYALARWGGPERAWARIAVMVLLGDVVFLLVAKDPDTLWDPIGGVLLRLASGHGDWSMALVAPWLVGSAALWGGLAIGRRAGGWIASDHGQSWIARGVVAVLAAVAATVGMSARAGVLDEVTAAITAHGHLAVLLVLGVGIGASQTPAYRALGRVVILFVASSLFYHAWAAAMPGPYRYLLALLLATIVLDYYLGLWIERTEHAGRRKALLVVSLCSNLGILVFFKYADFFTQDVLGLPVRPLALILPAGISFHTFQSLSYTIDVYRRQLRATRSVIQFATFVLFFPQLVAGPIVRAQDLLPQLNALPRLELAAANDGLFRIVVGLFKKIALADPLALGIVDRVFEAPERFSAIEVVAGVYGYALQIYLDFSAYSDIAIGSAQVLGFTLPENFRTPYRSANLQEFWRRWHISLSTWLRDYVYITLGGNHGAPWRTYVNLIATMVIGGLWHGASWAFIVWGALHGGGLAVTRYFQRGAASWRWLAVLAGVAVAGMALQRTALQDLGAWPQLIVTWLYLTPLWAGVTAWLSADRTATEAPRASSGAGDAATDVVVGAPSVSATAAADDATASRKVLSVAVASKSAGARKTQAADARARKVQAAGSPNAPSAKKAAKAKGSRKARAAKKAAQEKAARKAPAAESKASRTQAADSKPSHGARAADSKTSRKAQAADSKTSRTQAADSKTSRKAQAADSKTSQKARAAGADATSNGSRTAPSPAASSASKAQSPAAAFPPKTHTDAHAGLIADDGLPWRALFRRDPEISAQPGTRRAPLLLRLAMCIAALGALAAVAWAPSWTWIPLVLLTWLLGIAADAAEHGASALRARLASHARRALAVVLVFQYVCLAWIFFRASSFDNALAVLRQIATLELDHANLVPVVTTTLVVAFAAHLFAGRSFAWLRRRFVALPPWAQGLVLAGAALVLRELGHTKIVPFIYFQF